MQTGRLQDKSEIGVRVEWTGLGIFLWTSPAIPEKVAEAVGKILANGEYKRRALELKEEAANFGALDVVEREILALAES